MPLFPIDYPADKPNAGMAAALAGFALREHDGAWVVETPDQATADACQAFLDGFDAVAAAKASAKARLRAVLDRRATVDRAQNEALGLLAEALRIAVQNSGAAFASWPAAARTRVTAINNRIKRFEDLTNAADLIGADIDAMTDPAAIEGFDPDSSGRWPTA